MSRHYTTDVLEAFSQLVNAVHGGHPHETFSARIAKKRDVSNRHCYWSAWIWLFETFWPGHLDWALTPDEDETCEK